MSLKEWLRRRFRSDGDEAADDVDESLDERDIEAVQRRLRKVDYDQAKSIAGAYWTLRQIIDDRERTFLDTTDEEWRAVAALSALQNVVEGDHSSVASRRRSFWAACRDLDLVAGDTSEDDAEYVPDPVILRRLVELDEGLIAAEAAHLIRDDGSQPYELAEGPVEYLWWDDTVNRQKRPCLRQRFSLTVADVEVFHFYFWSRWEADGAHRIWVVDPAEYREPSTSMNWVLEALEYNVESLRRSMTAADVEKCQ